MYVPNLYYVVSICISCIDRSFFYRVAKTTHLAGRLRLSMFMSWGSVLSCSKNNAQCKASVCIGRGQNETSEHPSMHSKESHTTTVTIVHHLRVLVVASDLRSLSLSRSQDLKSCDQTMISDQMYFCVPDPIPSRFASTCSRTSRPLCHHPMTRIIDFCCLLLTPRHFLVLLV
jgi:hypothetical protein